MPATATQADRLAKIYGQITGGEKLPEALEAEALTNDTQPESITLPKLHLMVSGENRILADLVADMTAAIVSDGTLYYFELTCTSDATAHAFMAALVDKSKDRTWEARGDIFGSRWKHIEMPEGFGLRDTRLTIHGWHSGSIHHVAALAKESKLIIANNDDVLWMKLRERMTAPTMPHWGPELMPHIRRSGILMETETYGIGDDINAYIVAPDAQDLFDRIVRDYVLEHGLA